MQLETKNTTLFDPKAIELSKHLAGQTEKTRIPFIPILEVNNKKQKKMAVIDGQEQEVELPAIKGFILTEKNESEYTKRFVEGEIDVVILKERYCIEKKYKEGSIETDYRSNEFDSWNENITLFNKSDRKDIVFEGNYSDIKNKFTSVNDKGETKKDYSLFLVLYINYCNNVYRLKLKVSGDLNWFEYKNSFGDLEPWAGFVTHVKLNQNTIGTITYWYVKFERGQAVDLGEQITLQKEINKYFYAVEQTLQKPFDVPPVTDGDYIPKEDIDITQIPF